MSDVSALERTGQFIVRPGKGGQEEVVERPHRHSKGQWRGAERGRSGEEVAYRKGLQPKGPKTKTNKENLKQDLSLGFKDYKESPEGLSGENRSPRKSGGLGYREETPGFSPKEEQIVSDAVSLLPSEKRKTRALGRVKYFGRKR